MKRKIIVCCMLISIFLISSFVCANTATNITSIVGGNPQPTPIDNGVVGNFLATFQFVGYAIAIGMLMYVGIKYTMSAADARADMKTSMIKYVIGAILIAGADAIFGWIIGLA